MKSLHTRQQIIQLIFQTNFIPTDSRKVDRNYTQIYSDLLQLREVHNNVHDYGKLLPIPMNGKTWEEEKADFWNNVINTFNKKLRDGKVTTCEIKSEFEAAINHFQAYKNLEGIWNHLGQQIYDSSDYDFNGQGVTVDEAIYLVARIISGSATEQEKKKVDNLLNNIGTSACEPRAQLDGRFHESEDTIAKNTGILKVKKSTSFSIT